MSERWGAARPEGLDSHHETELIARDGGLWEAHCLTCNWRPAEFSRNEHEADKEQRQHHHDVKNGTYAVAPRTVNMASSIRHARDMAERETTPATERAEWVRIADEMERHLKTKSRTKAHEILDGQEALDF